MAARKFLLQVEPSDKIKFVGDSKGEIRSQLRITNKSDTKQAFKVKCTRNDLFKIRPASGILDYNQSAIVSVTYKSNGEQLDDDKLFFGVYHIPAPEGCTCDGAWAEHYGASQGELRIRVGIQEKLSTELPPTVYTYWQ